MGNMSNDKIKDESKDIIEDEIKALINEYCEKNNDIDENNLETSVKFIYDYNVNNNSKDPIDKDLINNHVETALKLYYYGFDQYQNDDKKLTIVVQFLNKINNVRNSMNQNMEQHGAARSKLSNPKLYQRTQPHRTRFKHVIMGKYDFPEKSDKDSPTTSQSKDKSGEISNVEATTSNPNASIDQENAASKPSEESNGSKEEELSQNESENQSQNSLSSSVQPRYTNNKLNSEPIKSLTQENDEVINYHPKTPQFSYVDVDTKPDDESLKNPPNLDSLINDASSKQKYCDKIVKELYSIPNDIKKEYINCFNRFQNILKKYYNDNITDNDLFYNDLKKALNIFNETENKNRSKINLINATTSIESYISDLEEKESNTMDEYAKKAINSGISFLEDINNKFNETLKDFNEKDWQSDTAESFINPNIEVTKQLYKNIETALDFKKTIEDMNNKYNDIKRKFKDVINEWVSEEVSDNNLAEIDKRIEEIDCIKNKLNNSLNNAKYEEVNSLKEEYEGKSAYYENEKYLNLGKVADRLILYDKKFSETKNKYQADLNQINNENDEFWTHYSDYLNDRLNILNKSKEIIKTDAHTLLHPDKSDTKGINTFLDILAGKEKSLTIENYTELVDLYAKIKSLNSKIDLEIEDAKNLPNDDELRTISGDLSALAYYIYFDVRESFAKSILNYNNYEEQFNIIKNNYDNLGTNKNEIKNVIKSQKKNNTSIKPESFDSVQNLPENKINHLPENDLNNNPPLKESSPKRNPNSAPKRPKRPKRVQSLPKNRTNHLPENDLEYNPPCKESLPKRNPNIVPKRPERVQSLANSLNSSKNYNLSHIGIGSEHYTTLTYSTRENIDSINQRRNQYPPRNQSLNKFKGRQMY